MSQYRIPAFFGKCLFRINNKFDPQPYPEGWEKSSSVAPARSALLPWRRRISKVTFPTAVRVRWSGASWTRRPKPNFWISAPACRQETTTARPVGFAVRFRLRDYLRQGVAHSDPREIELLAPDPGAKNYYCTYFDFYHKNICYSATGYNSLKWFRSRRLIYTVFAKCSVPSLVILIYMPFFYSLIRIHMKWIANSQPRFKEHLLSHLPTWKCEVCDKICASRCELEGHMKVHTEEIRRCPACSRSFSDVREHISCLSKSEEVSQCVACSLSLPTRKSYADHMQSHTTREAVLWILIRNLIDLLGTESRIIFPNGIRSFYTQICTFYAIYT